MHNIFHFNSPEWRKACSRDRQTNSIVHSTSHTTWWRSLLEYNKRTRGGGKDLFSFFFFFLKKKKHLLSSANFHQSYTLRCSSTYIDFNLARPGSQPSACGGHQPRVHDRTVILSIPTTSLLVSHDSAFVPRSFIMFLL